jgi:hypothetical protein
MMNHKVVPFRAQISSNGTMTDVAKQVEKAIEQETSSGWEFVSCGNIDAYIEGTNGCFGIGAKPASMKSMMVLVFKK